MKVCPKCEINYILNDTDEFCSVCNESSNHRSSNTDNNKLEMERNLLPKLRQLPENTIQALTKKEFTFNLFKLSMPLLVECKQLGKECCKQEVRIGKSDMYRYYIEPYEINGKYYHVCSQWHFDNTTNSSKLILQIFKDVKI